MLNLKSKQNIIARAKRAEMRTRDHFTCDSMFQYDDIISASLIKQPNNRKNTVCVHVRTYMYVLHFVCQWFSNCASRSPCVSFCFSRGVA